ncbi:TPA: hypothetical protein KXY69_004697 [Raoultella ornithinolytica]|nr:hypothetical protein [Raoultella ornithinolytica]
MRNSMRYPDGEIIHNISVSYCPQGDLSVTAVKPIADSVNHCRQQAAFFFVFKYLDIFYNRMLACCANKSPGYDIHHIQF